MFCKKSCLKKLLITQFFILFIFSFTFSQPTERLRKYQSYWGNLETNYHLSNGSFFFFTSNLRYSTLPNSNDHITESLPFYRAHLQLGYEHRFDKYWSIGISARPAFEKQSDIFYTQAYLKHTGFIKEIEFVKQFAFELISYSNEFIDNTGRSSFYFHLAKSIHIKNLHFRPQLSYELFMIYAWDKDVRSRDEQRRVDKTRLRFSWNYISSNEKSQVGLFFMRETDYFIAQEVYGEMGELLKPERKLNLITPTIGLSFLYTINPTNQAKKVYDLP